MALSIDGSANNNASSSTAPTVTLSTSLTNDIIIVVVGTIAPTTPVVVTSITDTAGLTWAQRSSKTYLATTQNNIEVWWAKSTGILSSDVITINLNSAPFESAIIAFGINGADFGTSPWDTNGSLPANASSGSAGIPTVSGVSTTAANSILFGFEVHTSTAADTAGSGFTLIASKAAPSIMGVAAQYKIVSSPQSSVSVAFGTSQITYGIIADAIRQEAAIGQATFGGVGNLSADTSQVSTIKQGNATFAGAGNLSARANTRNIRAQFAGVGSLSVTATGGVAGVVATPTFTEKQRLALTYVEIDVPEFPPTYILLNFDDIHSPPDSPPLITDSNTAGSEHTWTASGNATLSSGTVKFGASALLLDGTGDFSTTPDSEDFTLGDDDFTIDCFFNCTSPSGALRDLAGQQDAALTPSLSAWNIHRIITNVMRFQVFVGSTTYTVTGTTQFTDALNTGWHHLAALRTDDTLKLFLDGTQQGGNVSISGSVNNSTSKIGVGTLGDGTTGGAWLGSIDAFRFTRGIARWVSAFTPPTSSDDGMTTYRFAIDTAYLPTDIDCIPNIIDAKLSPAIISLGENLGQRASLTVRFRDHKHKFFAESFDSGSFWGKFRGRYGLKLQGNEVRFIQGFVGQSIDTMETRTYIIESIDGPSTTGEFKIVAKDLFKLADGDRAQAPTPSNGFVSANITNVAASLTLSPTGIGIEYPASGYANLGGKEIVSFTRSGDVLTITRAQYNTVAQAHDAQTRVQLCLRYSAQDVADIIYDLMVTYAEIDSAFIPLTAWSLETDTYLNVVYSALIAEPTAVNKLISELIEQAGLAMWWDEIDTIFRLQVLHAIPTNAQVYDGEIIVRQSLKVKEQLSKRLSQVYVYFDKINPILKDDQLENYRSTAFDSDTQAEQEYGAVAIKKIFSRWIPASGRSIADTLIAILLARFRDPPRQISFDLFRDESGDIPVLGAGYQIEGWCFQDLLGEAVQVPVQLTSINAAPDHFEVEAEEMLFTSSVAVSSPDVHTVIIDASLNNVNLENVHDSIYTVASSGVTINCTIQSGVTIGSTSAANPAFTVGTFVAGVTVNLTINGRIEGMAGDGGAGANGGAFIGFNGGAGGTALYTRQAINLTDTSGQTWGGGGGGGGGGYSILASNIVFGSGGGGAGGQLPGAGGVGGGAGGFNGSTGTTEAGGAGGANGASPFGNGGAGGDPGSNGSAGIGGNTGGAAGAGGATGVAIDGISFVTTIGTAGSRLGGTIN